ncbi:MAG: hypothetical protein QOI11_3922 [Candidatus Eremiobacteraeota bacterium]|nr:hypothetical protein [Candidatus Eremiobacteraeota bacterium]
MLSSPERRDRRRTYLALALLASLLVHLTAGGLWAALGHRIVSAIARVLPRPTPTPDVTALASLIRIEKRRALAAVVPPTKRRRAEPPPPAAAQPPARALPRAAPAPPRSLARAPAQRSIPVPKLAPAPKPVPTRVPPKPVLPAQREPVRQRLAHADVSRSASSASAGTNAATAAHNGLSPQQIAALDGQFRSTIDAAQHALSEAPAAAAQQSGSGTRTMKSYGGILAGRSDDALASEGVCDPLDTPTARGGYNYYYLRCRVTFTDGYTEEVSFPWQFRFTPRDDPFRYQDGRPHHFPVQPPPDGFALQRPFALSRTICAFYHADCEAVVAKERAAGETQ